MQPDRAFDLLTAATGKRESNDVAVAQALYGMIAVLGVEDEPEAIETAAVFLGHGALYLANYFEGEMAAVGAMIPPEVMDLFKSVIGEVATVFRDVALYAKERSDGE